MKTLHLTEEEYDHIVAALGWMYSETGSYKAAELQSRLEEQLPHYGPSPACPECGMGGDVGGTEPNPIPF